MGIFVCTLISTKSICTEHRGILTFIANCVFNKTNNTVNTRPNSCIFLETVHILMAL